MYNRVFKDTELQQINSLQGWEAKIGKFSRCREIAYWVLQVSLLGLHFSAYLQVRAERQ